MKRTTISLPDELYAALEREARRCRTSVSAVARDAIVRRLGRDPEKNRLPFIGLGRSGQRHTARNVESILAEEWGDARNR